jgi:nitronate monooxygenase
VIGRLTSSSLKVPVICYLYPRTNNTNVYPSLSGNEAGGHGYGSSPPVKQLLSSVLPLTTDNGPLILGSGGVATGAQVADLLNIGASGVVLGTRFSMTTESQLGEPQKKALLSAGPNLSVRSMAFDEARDTTGWPRGVDGRGLRTG